MKSPDTILKILTSKRDEDGYPIYIEMTQAELDAKNKRREELRRNYQPTPAEAALLTALEEHMTYDVDAFGVDAYTAHQIASPLTAAGFEIVPATKSEPETAEERRRREVSIMTAFTYDDLRAKLLSMSSDEAAAELKVSVALIEEFRGRLGIVDWRPRS
ncbi:MAG: hypothetical protein ABS75_20585 [Pelagibacterium sp. SCN 63-23]|nr:MAG: hypothetical protein ABS75_20585 [Pelagibacterium sp. SCN 63-23]